MIRQGHRNIKPDDQAGRRSQISQGPSAVPSGLRRSYSRWDDPLGRSRCGNSDLCVGSYHRDLTLMGYPPLSCRKVRFSISAVSVFVAASFQHFGVSVSAFLHMPAFADRFRLGLLLSTLNYLVRNLDATRIYPKSSGSGRQKEKRGLTRRRESYKLLITHPASQRTFGRLKTGWRLNLR